jgi:hypothetical protein
LLRFHFPLVGKHLKAYSDTLQTASNWAKSFDILLDAYKQLAENFPLLMQYRSMFQDNDHMKKILVWIFEDILKFNLRALRVFTQPSAFHLPRRLV